MRYYYGLKILWLVVRVSKCEFFLLFIFMIMVIMFYVIFIFCMEFFEVLSYYNNIYIGMWWLFIIMIIVGYGDFYFNFVLGYILVLMCVLIGIIFMGMFVFLIVRNFYFFYGL